MRNRQIVEKDKRIEDFKLSILKKDIENLRSNTDLLVVLGIGGSQLGAKAVLDAIHNYNEYNVVFLGDNLDLDYLSKIKNEKLINKKLTVMYASLSGNTYETNFVYNWIKKQEDLDIYSYTFITKESNKAFEDNLRANDTVYYVANSTSGRYSVFTEVGLVPLIYCGIDVDSFLKVGTDNRKEVLSKFVESVMFGGLLIVSTDYKPYINLLKWTQQLIMESTGKENKGLLVLPVSYPEDLHSVEQYLQEGGFKWTEIFISNGNKKFKSVIKNSHKRTLIYDLNTENKALSIGEFMTDLCLATICLCEEVINVNPFNQPGVEIYKKEFNKANE